MPTNDHAAPTNAGDLLYAEIAAGAEQNTKDLIEAALRVQESGHRVELDNATASGVLAGHKIGFQLGRDFAGGNGAKAEVLEPVRFEVLTGADLDALPVPDRAALELCGPYVRRGQRTIIAGDSGVGKSTLIAHMVSAIVHEDLFLDSIGAGGRVLIIDLEQGTFSAQRVARETKLTVEGVDFILVPDGLSLDSNEEQRKALEDVFEAKEYAVVVLDPFYKSHTGDSNDERLVTDTMRVLDAWRERYGFGLIMAAHVRKGLSGQSSGLTQDDIFGSGAFRRGAEVVLGLERKGDGYGFLHVFKDRDGFLPLGKQGLMFTRETGWAIDPEYGKERNVAADVYEWLGGQRVGEWYTVDEIKAPADAINPGVGAGRDAVVSGLGLLTAEGSIEHKIGPPGRSVKANCWRRIDPDGLARGGEAS